MTCYNEQSRVKQIKDMDTEEQQDRQLSTVWFSLYPTYNKGEIR